MKDTTEPLNTATPKPLLAIRSEQALRKVISNYPKILDKRVQTSLDQYSEEFIGVANVAIVATHSPHGLMFPILKQADGLSIRDRQHLVLANVSDTKLQQNDHYPLHASLYILAPGIGHALRINGTLVPKEPHCYLFTITQLYFHCARAAARANFWQPEVPTNLCPDNFISKSSYLLLKTNDRSGNTEISPRGDGAGFVKQLSATTLLLPERPGNKVAVSLRNIISCPDVELLFMVPGTSYTLNVQGTAELISSCELLDQCTVNGKAPKVGILITVQATNFQLDPVLEDGDIWSPEKTISKDAITAFPKALSAHINGTGLLGKATTAIIGAVVKHDMKNLY